MTDYSAPREREMPAIALQERLRTLEVRVAALTEALQVLTRGLEDLPTAEPGGRPAAKAARTAREMLLSVQSGQAATPRD
jgi:hypothetical protein